LALEVEVGDGGGDATVKELGLDAQIVALAFDRLRRVAIVVTAVLASMDSL